jgi:YXWGXW repeat-containing protein
MKLMPYFVINVVRPLAVIGVSLIIVMATTPGLSQYYYPYNYYRYSHPYAQPYTAPSAPPPEQFETAPPSPGPGYAWYPGSWAWSGASWVWNPGRYVASPQPHAVWIPGRWRPSASGWVWAPGHWR